MTGVVSGNFDLQWLFHSLSIEENELGLPVLVLDGLRGTDALKQFFLARRYLYRHIYYHPTVRAGQILVKSIFERIRDVGSWPEIRERVPSIFAAILDRRPFTLGEFLQITDVEVLYTIGLLADNCADETLRYLCKSFVNREFPKCVLDSGKLFDRRQVTSRFFEADIEKSAQITMFGEVEPNVNTLVQDLKDYLSIKVKAQGLPPEIVEYIVSADKVTFSSTPPSDLMFSYKSKVFGYDSLPDDHDGRNMTPALDSFSLWRVFVPSQFRRECAERLSTRHPELAGA